MPNLILMKLALVYSVAREEIYPFKIFILILKVSILALFAVLVNISQVLVIPGHLNLQPCDKYSTTNTDT